MMMTMEGAQSHREDEAAGRDNRRVLRARSEQYDDLLRGISEQRPHDGYDISNFQGIRWYGLSPAYQISNNEYSNKIK
jgi:hypothetical protein